MLRRAKDRTLVGICFILLLVGHEATRVIESIDQFGRHARSHLSAKDSGKSAEVGELKSVNRHNTMNDRRALTHSLQNLRFSSEDDAETGNAGEVARGVLSFGSDPNPYYVVLRAAVREEGTEVLEEEAGTAVLDFYSMYPTDWEPDETFTMEDFHALKPVPSTWPRAHQIVLRHDDLAMVKQDKVGTHIHVRGEHWTFSGKEQKPSYQRTDAHFSEKVDFVSIFLKGSDRWFDLTTSELQKTWVNSIRTVQTMGTCLESGQCIMQCTWIESEKGCNSDEFCNKVKRKDELEGKRWLGWHSDERLRCEPRKGYDENMKAWSALVTNGKTIANKIAEDGCVAEQRCQDDWAKVNRINQLQISLHHQLKGALENKELVESVGEMKKFMEWVVVEQTAYGATLYNTQKMGQAWDAKRNDPKSALSTVLKQKKCGEMEDRALETFTKFAFKPDDEEIAKKVEQFQRSCSLFLDAESEGVDGVQSNANKQHEMGEKAKDLQDKGEDVDAGDVALDNVDPLSMSLADFQAMALISEGSNSTALVELSRDGTTVKIPLGLIFLAVGAIALIFTSIGVALFLSSRSCAAHESQGEKSCRRQYLDEPSECDKDFNMGVWFGVAGGVLLVATFSAMVFTAAGPMAAGAGAIKGVAGKIVAGKVGTLVAGNAWQAVQHVAKKDALKKGVTNFLNKGSLMMGAYVWSEIKKATDTEWQKKAKELSDVQGAGFRQCMANINEPINDATGQTADKLLLESTNVDQLKKELAKKYQEPGVKQIFVELTQTAYKQVVSMPGKQDFAVDIMKILTNGTETVSIPGIGELPMETVLKMAENKIKNQPLTGKDDEIVNLPGVGKVPLSLIKLLNNGTDTVNLPFLGDVKIQDLAEHMKTPSTEEMKAMPTLQELQQGYFARDAAMEDYGYPEVGGFKKNQVAQAAKAAAMVHDGTTEDDAKDGKDGKKPNAGCQSAPSFILALVAIALAFRKEEVEL